MEHLLRLIHTTHAREFSRPPIGPLGYHLDLHDDRWGVAVQAAIGGMLDNMFVVHDWQDQQLLRVCFVSELDRVGELDRGGISFFCMLFWGGLFFCVLYFCPGCV